MLNFIKLYFFMLNESVIMLRVIMLKLIMLRVIMLNVIILCVIIVSVAAPIILQNRFLTKFSRINQILFVN